MGGRETAPASARAWVSYWPWRFQSRHIIEESERAPFCWLLNFLSAAELSVQAKAGEEKSEVALCSAEASPAGHPHGLAVNLSAGCAWPAALQGPSLSVVSSPISAPSHSTLPIL